jgi:zinc protease
MRLFRNLTVAALAALLAGCQGGTTFEIDYEQYTLDNGLTVILHEDRSDPIAAVAVLYHVGSNRETPGKTGFAHLFEHMMFQSSQHVGEDQFFRKIQAAGGTLNGGTGNDNTIYFEIVPNNSLEMALWLEADRMGYLLPTVTQEALLNQQDVVQNEKRQRVDNVPYGHTSYMIGKLLYPEGHPYNWPVIGSFEDLANATADDVREFFTQWYGPNNATLVVAGDYDVEQTKAWIEKYFGELPSPATVVDPNPQHVTLSETKRAYHEDNFARSPELNMVYPTVENYGADSYALQFLGQLLSDGKKAPLYKVIVEQRRLAPSASAFQGSQEITGSFRFRVRAFPNTSLSDIEAAIFEALSLFEEEGFTERDLDRIKAQLETSFYNGISSVLGKSFQLASYNEFAGSPGAIAEDFENTLAVTSDDVWRVYNEYIKDKNFVLTSFVPRNQTELVAANSERFSIVEETITAAGVGGAAAEAEGEIIRLPSSFDRSVEPPKGPAPDLTIPEMWSHTYANGLRIYGIEYTELPLVQFGLTLKGGMLLDDIEKVGVANLMTDIMMEGTANKTPLELEEAIDELGASINMFTGSQSITVQANTLRSNLGDVYALFEEILLEPRWDEEEFDRIKRETIETINRRSVSPSTTATSVYNKLLYGEDHILSHATLGTPETVESIAIEDLKAFYETNYSPSVSHISIVGDISQDEAITLFAPLEGSWEAKEVEFRTYADPPAPSRARLYFVDFPGARQSEIRIGYVALKYTDPDYYPATVMNYQLGGSFNGRVNIILREEKGYTYGARSGFSGSSYPGPFTASSGVRSNATLESVQIFKDEIENYREGISEEDLTFTKANMIQSNALRFETLGALRGMLNSIGMYDLPFDYIEQREGIVRDMTLERHRELAQQYLPAERMIYLVVGDGQTQLGRLNAVGLGTPIVLDRDGNRVRR